MIQTKQTYEAPEAEALVVRFEGVVCTSPGATIQNWQDDGNVLNF